MKFLDTRQSQFEYIEMQYTESEVDSDIEIQWILDKVDFDNIEKRWKVEELHFDVELE